MLGYIFETTNKQTGETYIGKRYSVRFDKDYFGEADNKDLAIAIEKYGKPSFEVKMIRPFEGKNEIDDCYNRLCKENKSMILTKDIKKEVKPEQPAVVEDVEKPVVEEEKKPAKRGRKKKTEGE